jgi:hypothetical protein
MDTRLASFQAITASSNATLFLMWLSFDGLLQQGHSGVTGRTPLMHWQIELRGFYLTLQGEDYQ